MTPLAIDMRGLHKSFLDGDRKRVLFDKFDFSLEAGKFLVLLGKSGSGKTTFLNLLSGLELPDQGEMLVLGQNLQSRSENERALFRRQSIGFIFQFFNLVPTLTILENLLLPLELKYGAITESHREKARHLLGEVGLADRATDFPQKLSGGEQQRVAVVRALIHEPEMILADEPTGNLDVENGQKVISLLTQFVKKHGKTLVMVTHSRDMIGTADLICELKGQKLAYGAV